MNEVLISNPENTVIKDISWRFRILDLLLSFLLVGSLVGYHYYQVGFPYHLSNDQETATAYWNAYENKPLGFSVLIPDYFRFNSNADFSSDKYGSFNLFSGTGIPFGYSFVFGKDIALLREKFEQSSHAKKDSECFTGNFTNQTIKIDYFICDSYKSPHWEAFIANETRAAYFFSDSTYCQLGAKYAREAMCFQKRADIEKFLSSFKFTDPVGEWGFSNWSEFNDGNFSFRYPVSWKIRTVNNGIAIIKNDENKITITRHPNIADPISIIFTDKTLGNGPFYPDPSQIKGSGTLSDPYVVDWFVNSKYEIIKGKSEFYVFRVDSWGDRQWFYDEVLTELINNFTPTTK